MYRNIFFIVLLFTIIPTALGQDENYEEEIKHQLGIASSLEWAKQGGNENFRRLGYSCSFVYTRDNIQKKGRFEMNLTYSRFNHITDKYFKQYIPLADTFSIWNVGSDFLDLAFKTNLDLIKYENFRIKLIFGVSIGTFLRVKKTGRYYLTIDESFLYKTEPNKYSPFEQLSLGLQIGLDFEIPIKNNFSMHLQPIISSKGSGAYEGWDGFSSFGFNFGIRKNF